MPALTRANIAAFFKRFNRAVELAAQAAEKEANAYLSRQAKGDERKTLTPFRPGPKGQAGVFVKSEPLIKPAEPLVKSTRLFESKPLVEAKPLIEKPVPATKGKWKPTPGQLREATLAAAKVFNRTMRQNLA